MPTPSKEEHVVLVDDHDVVLGTAPKLTVHGPATPLHRGFSLFLFDDSGRLLLQQRARHKKTWPGVWSNSCCGHPRLGEAVEDAARRRLRHELGVEARDLRVLLPDFRYRAVMDGIVENELCPVLVARLAGESPNPRPNPDEVEGIRWISWTDWLAATDERPNDWSPWAVRETEELARSEEFENWRNGKR